MIATEVQIRFGDCDLAGHVHNAAYLHYFESARINFFVAELGKDWDWREQGFILKKNEIDYLRPIQLEDQIKIEVRAIHIGTKSFTLSYSIIVTGTQVCHGESVVVCFNHKKGETIPIPKDMLVALNKHLDN
jgi:acyl-CoA thioester hydrolase